MTRSQKAYEFIERPDAYELTLNGAVDKKYPKHRFSKREAEEKAADVVNKAYEKYGIRLVTYYGLLSVEDFKNNH